LVRASGSSQLVTAAFGTTLRTYRGSTGAAYFANATAVQVPAELAPDVLGVLGLSDTLTMHSTAAAVPAQAPASAAASSPGSCQSPYPTVPLLVQGVLSGISSSLVPRGYGGGPGCSGLTPGQVNSIYGAPAAGPRAKGAGVTMALFELSAYQQSDVDTWAHTFYGPQYTPPLTDINVDGGPKTPACPAGDACVPGSEAYFYDIEPAGDIEMQLAIAPDARRIDVYNAPDDALGITELDEYHKIAADDTASVVSTSWGLCETDAGSAYEQAQNVIFEQMAAQGQSVFAAAGDTGPYGCIRNDGPAANGVSVWDPAVQPWVTAVGGTSMENFNPMASPQPAYSSQESVWNVDGLCNSSANEGSPLGPYPPITGYDWCAITLAGGGGSSTVFGRPAYQVGRGVNNPYTATGCSLASAGAPCREIPDVSADADEFTPYAEYCTGNASTPDSYCAGFTAQPDPGWIGFAGTSAAAPLWSGIAADRDSWQGARSGNLNPLLYLLYNLAPGVYFHDITGTGQPTSNNGLFPAVPGYDEATGIGTPRMAALITETL
jgi:kumamolisin